MINPTLVTVRRTALAAALLALVSCLPLSAQTAATGSPAAPRAADNSDRIALSPFLVSDDRQDGYVEQQTMAGSRSSKNVIEIPSSVVIVNREAIDDLGAITPVEAINFGVSGVSQGTTYFDAVNIRGFGISFFLRNGVTKTTFKTSPMYDVERIEVIKGPAAMLLGNNVNLGGSVNLISRRASATQSGDLQLTLAENNYYRAAATLSGPAVKSEDFKLNYRITAGYLKGDRDKEIQNEDERFIGGAVDMYFGSNTSILVNGYVFQNDGYRYWDDFLDLSTALVYPGAAGGKGALRWGKLNPNSTRTFSPGRRKDVLWENNDSYLDVTLLTKLTKNGNLRLFYSVTALRDERDIMRGITLQTNNYMLNRQFLPFHFEQVDHNFQVDYLHQWELKNVKFNTTLGGDGYNTNYRQALSVNTAPALDTRMTTFPDENAFFAQPLSGVGSPFTTDNEQKPTQYTYYVQEDISFWQDRVRLVGGLRWITPGGTNRNRITNVVSDRVNATLRVHKYGVVVKVLPTVSVYYTNAINIRQQVGFVDLNRGGDQLVPQKNAEGTLDEIGAKFNQKLSDRLSVFGTVAYYKMSLSNIRINHQFPDGSYGQIQNARDSSKGWEFDSGLRANVGDGHADVIFTYANGTSAPAADSTLLTDGFVPIKISGIAKYTWTSGPLKGFMLGAAVMDQSDSRAGNYMIDRPLSGNAFARYQWSRWAVQVNVENLTNARYISGLITQGLVEGSEPRQIRMDVRYRW